MKQVTLNIPERKFNLFMELVESLGFTKDDNFEISEEHKQIVRQRIEASKQNPYRLLDWEDVKNDFIFS